MKRMLTILVTVAVTTGCATIPDGCYTNAYTGMESCYQSNEVVSQRELTDQEHLRAIQQERLRLQQQQAQSQAFMNAAGWWMMMQPQQPRYYSGTFWMPQNSGFGTFNLYEY